MFSRKLITRDAAVVGSIPLYTYTLKRFVYRFIRTCDAVSHEREMWVNIILQKNLVYCV